MNPGGEPAFARLGVKSDDPAYAWIQDPSSGLSKREYAAIAMHAELLGAVFGKPGFTAELSAATSSEVRELLDSLPIIALRSCDALLAELAKPQEDKQ